MGHTRGVQPGGKERVRRSAALPGSRVKPGRGACGHNVMKKVISRQRNVAKPVSARHCNWKGESMASPGGGNC